MRDGLILAVLLVAWGAQVALPARIPGVEPERRRLWALAVPILLLAGSAAALLYVRLHPDETLAASLFPLKSSTPGRLLAVLFPSLLGASIVTCLGWRKMESSGWRILAGLGLGFLAVAALALELLRAGESQVGPLPVLLTAALCRVLIAAGSGELVSPGRPLLAVLAGLGLAAYWLVLPSGVVGVLRQSGHLFTSGAAVVLFLAARWVPPRLRRPALAGAVLLTGLFLATAAEISQALSSQINVDPLPPLPPM
ncbi:MAG TPA: hypothetical protein VHU81_10310 [Thermoanaerobaculia bacterium]|nr:hypothetical protein [Thermoanaerobaculia bacterium]